MIKRTINIIKFALVLATLTLVSCSLVHDDLSECSTDYSVRFIDDHNLKGADAFDAEVKSISLYAFNDSGALVWSSVKSAEQLNSDNHDHTLSLNALAPGKYHLVAWGGLSEGRGSFGTPRFARAATVNTPTAAQLSDLTCRLNRIEEDQYDYVDTDIDDLFHGTADVVIDDDEDYNSHVFDVHLTKNTNRINVMLQQVDGKEINPDDYDFIIEAENGLLNHDNSLLNESCPLYYFAYEKVLGSAGIANGDAEINSVSAVMARFTISRLVIDDWTRFTRPTLSIYNVATGVKVLSIPLIDYALMVRNNYDTVADDQDYLDRQDEYNFTFFLQNGRWLDSMVIINSWRIVLNPKDIE